MPQSQRWTIKRDIDRVIEHLIRGGNKINQLETLYRKNGKPMADDFLMCLRGIDAIVRLLEKIRDKI